MRSRLKGVKNPGPRNPRRKLQPKQLRNNVRKSKSNLRQLKILRLSRSHLIHFRDSFWRCANYLGLCRRSKQISSAICFKWCVTNNFEAGSYHGLHHHAYVWSTSMSISSGWSDHIYRYIYVDLVHSQIKLVCREFNFENSMSCFAFGWRIEESFASRHQVLARDW